LIVQASEAYHARAISTLENHLAIAAPPVAWLRWTELRYRLPKATSRLRVSVWRALRNQHALNLESGLWAIPHHEHDGVDVERVVRIIEGAGGEISMRVVGSADVDDVEQHVRLWRECERVWDDFFTELDRLTIRVTAGAGTPASHHDELQRLRVAFGELLVTDLVGSDGSTRAAVRLERVADALDDLPGLRVGAPRTPRVTVSVGAGWALDDGTSRYVLALRPTPTVAWDRALRDFEVSMYAPSTRPSVRHGAVVTTCPAHERDGVVGALQERVALFERYLTD
jgi:hypothetical protein